MPTDMVNQSDPGSPRATAVWKRLAIWAGFIVLVYLTRDFFFVAFMTFMFSYLALTVIGWAMKRIAPHQEKPRLRRLVTLAIFLIAPLLLVGIGALIMPKLIAQGQRLAGWTSQVSPETEVARLLEQIIGPMQFRQHYGGASDPRFQQGLAEFRATVDRPTAAYLEFPKQEAWIEGGFNRQFTDAERGRQRLHRIAEGTSSNEFEQWFLHKKAPQLQTTTATAPEQLLTQLRHDPAALAKVRQEWLDDSAIQGVAAAKQSPEYARQFRLYYDQHRVDAPDVIPYTFDQFIELQKARPQGPTAFANTLRAMGFSAAGENSDQLQTDFEATKKHDLFESWWMKSSSAKYVRQKLESGVSTGLADRVENLLASILNTPLDLATALLLSFFICIDFPALQRGCRRLRDTWLRDVYDEIAPALTSLGLLIGRAFRAQGLIAFCNVTLIFVALTMLGVEHSALLSAIVFVLCLVPTVGMMIAWVLIVAICLIQPGGGVMLALKASAAVFAVIMLETLFFSPRILGRLMELHPVLIIAILPIAHYFFGIWGLVLALPVTVFIINDVILCVDESSASVAKIHEK